MSRDDSDEIHRRLNDELESILDRYWSGWITEKRKGQDIALLTPRVKAKGRKPTSSFTVNLSGSDRGKWYRFSIGQGGGALALIHYGDRGSVPSSRAEWADAYRIAKDFLGIEDRQEPPEATVEREKRLAEERESREREAAQRKAEAEERAAERTLTAAEIWKGTISLKGSHGEAYLVERGLPPISEWPWCPDRDLRFHPSLQYERIGRFPCIIGRVADSLNAGTGVWRIFLDKDKPQKADVPNAKLGLGPASGGAVRLGGVGSHIGIAEGIESALAAWVLLGFKYPVWAGLSTSGMQSFEPPMEVERISIVPDGDKGMIDKQGRISDPPGINAARKLKVRMDAAGIRTTILEIPSLGDALDLLNTRRRHEQKTGGGSAAPNQSRGRADSYRESAISGV